MKQVISTTFCLFALGACASNPLSGVTTLNDVAVTEGAPSVAVVETDVATGEDAAIAAALKAVEADDPPASTGFFARVFGTTGGAGDAAPSGPDDATAQTASNGGFFGGLFGGAPKETPPEPILDVPEDPSQQQQAVAEAVEAKQPVQDGVAVTPETTPAPQQAGFFSRVFGGNGAAAEQEAEETPTPVSNSGGLFGLGAAPKPTGPDARQVPMNVLLPFGEVATNCEVSRGQLGTKVGEDSGYTLYDTIPNATALRTHYITGFKDRCARQFTAATAIMGDIGTHEVVRYLPANRSKPYSVTDNAYEELKASYCGAARGKPCGSRLDRFARRTVFVSAYKRFTTSPDWSNILLHDGRVIAMGPK